MRTWTSNPWLVCCSSSCTTSSSCSGWWVSPWRNRIHHRSRYIISSPTFDFADLIAISNILAPRLRDGIWHGQCYSSQGSRCCYGPSHHPARDCGIWSCSSRSCRHNGQCRWHRCMQRSLESFSGCMLPLSLHLIVEPLWMALTFSYTCECSALVILGATSASANSIWICWMSAAEIPVLLSTPDLNYRLDVFVLAGPIIA